MPRYGDITTAIAAAGVSEYAASIDMTVAEAAHFLRVSPTTVARAIASGDLPTCVGTRGVAVHGAAVLAKMRSPASMARRNDSGTRPSRRQGKETVA